MSEPVAAAAAPAAADPGALAGTLRGQMPVLDALRGVAILLVLAHRFNVTPDPESLPARLVCALMEAGWVGVQLFFVLSGFLITGILLDSRGSPSYYHAFFARRVLRIFPLYYVVLAVAFAVVPLLTGRQPEGHQHQLWLWIYLSNWVSPFGMGVAAFPHFWSLAVEEQFYLVWPFVVRALSRRRLAVVCAGLVVVALASRVVLRALDVTPEAPYQLTVCRVDALALGATAAWALRVPALAERLRARQRALVVATAALFVVGAAVTRGYPRNGFATQTIGYSILAGCATVLLVLGVLAQARGGRLAALLAPAPLRSFGKYSYGMYVFHVIIHHELGVPLLARLGQEHPTVGVTLAYFVAMSAVTYVVALASYHLWEKHFLALKRRFPVARQAT
jgi:peptidoglycan/LPS O-acetylase OafA/YrhL